MDIGLPTAREWVGFREADYTSISRMNRIHGSNCAMERSSNTMRERSSTSGVQSSPAKSLPVFNNLEGREGRPIWEVC